MANVYTVYNGVTPTAAAITPVTTGTAIKTMLQLGVPSTEDLIVIEWGISFNGSAAAAGIQCELVETSGAATVTALSAADVVKFTGPNDVAPTALTYSTTATGFTASGEGTPAGSRVFDYQYVSPAGGYLKQFPLGREPKVAASKFLRVRVTAAAAVNAICYVTWSE